MANKDERIVAITAAMPNGTGLDLFRPHHPKRYFDVGIAEEHAVIFAAGMATRGFRPVCAIYSTFLQRAFDPIVHDVALQKLPVLFCMDRAGLSGDDGPTHHGLFDIAYLRGVPGLVLMAPKDEDELADMMKTALEVPGPSAIRYPRGAVAGVTRKPEPAALPIGKAEVLADGSDVAILGLGPMTAMARQLAAKLERDGYSAAVINPRFIKPIDREMLETYARRVAAFVTFEDHVKMGGFGSAVLEALEEIGSRCSGGAHRMARPVHRARQGRRPAREIRRHRRGSLRPDCALAGAAPAANPGGKLVLASPAPKFAFPTRPTCACARPGCHRFGCTHCATIHIRLFYGTTGDGVVLLRCFHGHCSHHPGDEHLPPNVRGS